MTYHILYKKDDIYSSGVNISASSIEEALSVFRQKFPGKEIIAIYIQGIRP